jgi:hypothetical protein
MLRSIRPKRATPLGAVGMRMCSRREERGTQVEKIGVFLVALFEQQTAMKLCLILNVAAISG